MSTIPKNFHYVWFGSPIPVDYYKNILDMTTRNPDYRTRIWTNRPSIIYKTQDLRKAPSIRITVHNIMQCIDELKGTEAFTSKDIDDYLSYVDMESRGHFFANYAAASDLFRMLPLYMMGGIYVDTDVEPSETDSVGLLVADKGYLCFFHGNTFGKLNNCIIASVARDPFIKRCISLMLSNYRKAPRHCRNADGKVVNAHDYLDPENFWQRRSRLDKSSLVNRKQMTIALSGPGVLSEEVFKEFPDANRRFESLSSIVLPKKGFKPVSCDNTWLKVLTREKRKAIRAHKGDDESPL